MICRVCGIPDPMRLTWWNWEYNLRYVVPEIELRQPGMKRSEAGQKREDERLKKLEIKIDPSFEGR